MRKVIASLFIILCVSLPWISWAYFEEQFYCTIDKNIIDVSLTVWDEFCFTYLMQVSDRVEQLNDDIKKAESYLRQWRDNVYRTEVWKELRDSKANLVSLRTQLIAAVDDYEIELYLKVKSIVASYLMPKRQRVVDKIITANKLLTHLKEVGDIENYAFVVRQAEKLQQQLILYDSIRFSASFMELIPPLKIYIQWWWFQLDSIDDKPVKKDVT